MSKYAATGGIDPSTFTITDEPYTETKPVQGSKYDGIFPKLKQGQRLVCGSGFAGLAAQRAA